jgi:hypothetical protein
MSLKVAVLPAFSYGLKSDTKETNPLLVFYRSSVHNDLSKPRTINIAMPKKKGGGGHEHTEKAKRMAEHIEESEEKKEESPERSKEIAWRAVHKEVPPPREGRGVSRSFEN